MARITARCDPSPRPTCNSPPPGLTCGSPPPGPRRPIRTAPRSGPPTRPTSAPGTRSYDAWPSSQTVTAHQRTWRSPPLPMAALLPGRPWRPSRRRLPALASYRRSLVCRDLHVLGRTAHPAHLCNVPRRPIPLATAANLRNVRRRPTHWADLSVPKQPSARAAVAHPNSAPRRPRRTTHGSAPSLTRGSPPPRP